MAAARSLRATLVLLALLLLAACQPASPEPAVTTPPPAGMPASMADVYQALALEDLRLQPKPPEAGEMVVEYWLVNRSTQRLLVPPNAKFGRPYYLVGVIDEWVERLGGSGAIPGAPPWLERVGRRYRVHGGVVVLDFVPGKGSLEAGERVLFRRSFDIQGFPPGRYRYTVEFKTLPENGGGRVLQRLTAEFTLD